MGGFQGVHGRGTADRGHAGIPCQILPPPTTSDHNHSGVKQLQISEVFSDTVLISQRPPRPSVCPMMYEATLILFSPPQRPDYKQLFIVTYSNKG